MGRKLIEYDFDNSGKLCCDNKLCGYELPSPSPFDRLLIGYECPKCSSNMLTEQDYIAVVKLKANIDRVNKWMSWILIFFPSHRRIKQTIKVKDGQVNAKTNT